MVVFPCDTLWDNLCGCWGGGDMMDLVERTCGLQGSDPISYIITIFQLGGSGALHAFGVSRLSG